ncbi:unnamed protein product [Strongylus vulgaris]|uniref:Uncharacterized protein n=1 Tax=Strongylus vulgaris TaxID=40348 RepID=A0A3P7JSZ2_STRVU|nr:unnamed protein product [Strongylus vulgaris]
MLLEFQYSDFELSVHREVREYVLTTLKDEGGNLNEQVAESICNKMEEVS